MENNGAIASKSVEGRYGIPRERNHCTRLKSVDTALLTLNNVSSNISNWRIRKLSGFWVKSGHPPLVNQIGDERPIHYIWFFPQEQFISRVEKLASPLFIFSSFLLHEIFSRDSDYQSWWNFNQNLIFFLPMISPISSKFFRDWDLAMIWQSFIPHAG